MFARQKIFQFNLISTFNREHLFLKEKTKKKFADFDNSQTFPRVR